MNGTPVACQNCEVTELDVVTSPERGGGPLAVVGFSTTRHSIKTEEQRISELNGLPAGGMQVTTARTDSNPTHGRV